MSDTSILIRNGIIVTMKKGTEFIRKGAIYVENDRIVDIGKEEELARKYTAERSLDAKGGIVIPGLINAHTHPQATLLKGVCADASLLDWLTSSADPGNAEGTEQDAYVGELLGCMENIRTGSTYVVDNYYTTRKKQVENMNQIARAVKETGIRATLVGGYHDKGNLISKEFLYESSDAVVKDYTTLINKWHNTENGRIRVWVSPVNLLFCTPESIVMVHELAERHGIGIHTHTAESFGETSLIKDEYGKGYVEVFHDLGVLGPNFQAAHSVWLTDREIKLMYETRSSVVHNPAANMWLASGVAPVPALIKAGVNVALGTDACNCSNYVDLFETMRSAALLQKVHSLNPTVISARDVFRMCTVGGAKAVGLETEIGTLEVGKKADIVIMDSKSPRLVPLHDPIANLVYSASGNDVLTTIVDGRILMEDRVFKSVDADKVLLEAQEASTDLVARIGKLGASYGNAS